ncbi:PR domain zinc finger protein 13-like [Mercenaria mercenaria]|uniref:PR domain zinc finger protein 13-like n=1 Tax=Mercenaria mercenaria TaxID=6596 RepID=UPI00234F8C76|nr:PR domain zinc finger protein 13-like [Mercenaria mercenaria]
MDETRGISRKVHVIAGSVIPYGSWYGPVQKIDFHKEPERLLGETGTAIKIITDMGMLQAKNPSQNPWYQYLLPARDIHEQNLNLFRSRDGHLYLRATRDIDKGEVITCWYDEALAWEINVPYLTPANIIGIGRYCCTMCQKEFIYPNHLKLHIMRTCSGFEKSKDSLLHQDHTTESFPSSLTYISTVNTFPHDRKCNQDMIIKTENKRQDVCLPHSQVSTHLQDSCISRYTLKASFELVPNVPTYAVLRERRPYQIDVGNNLKTDLYVTSRQNQNSHQLDTDEEEPIEILKKSCSIMSSNKGHLCVFCGKLYSRKYGLKIHLRTHTGYKPLKCKICLRAFGDPSNLNKHIRLHAQGSTPYQCSICGKVLVRRRDLVRHLKSRHPNEVSQ